MANHTLIVCVTWTGTACGVAEAIAETLQATRLLRTRRTPRPYR